MINKKFNELEKAILNSDFIKKNKKFVKFQEQKKIKIGINEIKRKIVGGYFSSASSTSKENFYEKLKEIEIIKNEEEYQKIISEIDREDAGILFHRGLWKNPMNISKDKKGYFLKCYDPEQEL